jgi:TPR repeat protein
MAAAQAEREKALHEAEEALKQAADAQRRRARIRNTAFVVVSIFAVLAGSLGLLAEQQRRTADKSRQVAEEQREQADRILTDATNIIADLQYQMNEDNKKRVFAVFKTGADHGDANSMRNLGWAYENGFGVAQDYAKAREWYEKTADKGNTMAMFNLGGLYLKGKGVAQDYAKAREWFQKAANEGDTEAMAYLERLPSQEAFESGHYAEALQLQEASALKVEEAETKREGKPGQETALALHSVAWRALFVREFTKALTVADHAHALFPENLSIETNRAHALMFLERGEDSKALYLAYKGKPMSEQDARLWERVIADDFAEFRKAGLTHPMMADIEGELGVSP